MSEEILDQGMSANNDIDLKDRIASKGKRFLNYIIDTIMMYIAMIPLMGYFSASMMSDYSDYNGEGPLPGDAMSGIGTLYFGIFAIMLGYFILMEKLTGKTVGKYLTKTRIVKEDGTEPTWLNIIGRTLARMIPFEPISIFFSSDRTMWHDSLPKIYVIED